MKALIESTEVASRSLDIGARWCWVVTFKLRPFKPRKIGRGRCLSCRVVSCIVTSLHVKA
jgi:hypothetical protein